MLVIFARYIKYTCQLNYEAMQYALVRPLEWSHTQGSNNLDSGMIENDGTEELSCPDDLIKYIRPPCHDMDKSRQVINKKFQCLEQLLISCQNRWKLIKTHINKL